MADLSISDGALRIELSVAERVLALHGRDIVVPLGDLVELEPVDDIMSQLRGLRMPGTGVPGLVAIGTWRGNEDGEPFHDFALIHRRGPGVVAVTRNFEYARILFSADEPQQMIAALRA
ncbi:MAG: hypothetical protein ACRDNS_08460 [Trebonia sp.]